MMEMNYLRRYRFSFDPIALILFVLIMLPNIFWFAVPSINDVLREESHTPTVDLIGSVFQVIFIIALIIITRTPKIKFKFNILTTLAVVSLAAYYILWAFYYLGVVNSFLMLGLCIFPCASFIIYEIFKKNYIALIPTVLFTICHLTYCVFNFAVGIRVIK